MKILKILWKVFWNDMRKSWFIVSALLGGDDGTNFNNQSQDEDWMDEELKPCTDVWRSLHSNDYNQFDD